MVGVLKRKMDYGVFVNMLNNLTGLAPNKVLFRTGGDLLQLFNFQSKLAYCSVAVW